MQAIPEDQRKLEQFVIYCRIIYVANSGISYALNESKKNKNLMKSFAFKKSKKFD